METASAAALDFPSAPPRLAPLGWTWNPLVWLGILVYRLGTGGDALPVRVIFARAPRLLLAHLMLVGASEYSLSLERRLRSLARVFGSRVNGCRFCDDLETRLALGHGHLAREDVDALGDYASSARFSERERAALRYVEELNTTRQAGDECFANLRRHLSEREIVELTWLNGVGNYLNLMAKPLGLAPESSCALPLRSGAATEA